MNYKFFVNFLFGFVFFNFSFAFARLLRGQPYTSDALDDQIFDLPGLSDKINFNQFSGYLKLTGTQKQIHYWFVESESNPATDPVVFWTNGGPGCSGLLGFLTEQGPFKPDENMNLVMNEWRWNKIANMVFIEQPIGVGYSYSDNSDDYRIGDEQAAQDNLQVVLEFYEKFPQYASNPLYISSESYGGHYMPTWASAIVNYNKQNEDQINFKGFAVGNPYTDYYSGSGAQIQTYWDHQLLPKPLWDKYVDAGCTKTSTQFNTSICYTLMLDFMVKIGDLNPYALDYPVCVSAQQSWMTDYLFERNKVPNGLFGQTKQIIESIPLKDDYEPCEDNYATEYMNLPDVKSALHVNSDIEWEECSRTVKYELFDKFKPMEKYYRELLDDKEFSDLRIMVYSGDDDAVCATVGTQRWIWNLGYPVDSLWKTWSVDGQTSGYITQFKTPNSKEPRLTFATVHGAGHEVPTYKPKEAFVLFQAYLNSNYDI